MDEPTIILDKSFLQAESKQLLRLRALKESGCKFVLIDTLIYEVCTGKRDSMWLETQRKLFEFPDDILIWRHNAELLKTELAQKTPIDTPSDVGLTEQTQRWFHSRQEYVPADIQETCRKAQKQREEESVASLVKMCRTFASMAPEACKQLQQAVSQRVDVSPFCNSVVNDPRWLRWLIQLSHGHREEADVYLPGAEDGLDERWFAYHVARTDLALLCIFLSQYGEHGTPGKDFRHTKLDADYLALLHYADALATNETSGSMADLCSWLYGSSKIVFSTADVDLLLPSHEQVESEAYYEWGRSGRTHGHDVQDWLESEQRLWRTIWPRLAAKGRDSVD